jgi:DNA polymerase III alpha subunit
MLTGIGKLIQKKKKISIDILIIIVYIKSMITDSVGRLIMNVDSALELIYHGKKFKEFDLDQTCVDDYAISGKQLTAVADIDKNEFDKLNQQNWYMPDSYKNMDIEKYIYDLVVTDQERARVDMEIELYKKFNLYTVLKYLVYLIDLMRQNNIVWGVGRGSSVSSYVLFLIGIHKVDSIKYNLDINEFLR